MYSTSAAYKTAVDESGRTVKVEIDYGDVQVSSADVLSYFSLSDILLTDEKKSFVGAFPATRINYSLIGNQSGFIFTSANRQINATASLKVAGVYEDVPLGIFVVTQAPNDLKTDEINIEAMDLSIKFDKPYALEITWPKTVKEWATAICEVVGVELGSTSWLNSEVSLPEEVVIEGSYRDAIKHIAAAGASFAKIGRDGKLYFRTLTAVARDLTEVFEYQQGEVYGPINALVLTKDPTDDSLGVRDQDSIDLNGLTEVQIDNNPILETDRETLITGVFAALSGQTFTVTSIEYSGDPSLDVGDIVQFLDQDAVLQDLTILVHKFEHTGAWSGTVEAAAPSKTDIDTDWVGPNEARLVRAEIDVDKLKSEITIIADNVNIVAGDVSALEGEVIAANEKLDGVTITIVQQVDAIGAIQTATEENAAAIDATAEALALQKTYYNFGPDGQTIGRSDSPGQIRLEYDAEDKPQVVISDGFNDTTTIKSNSMTTKNIVVEESFVAGNHKVQKMTGSTEFTVWLPI